MNEEKLVEKPAHNLFEKLGYTVLEGKDVNKERNDHREVILTKRLYKKIRELNPDLPEYVYDNSISQIKSLPKLTTIENNREFHQMLLAGVKVSHTHLGQTRYYAVKLVDFENPQNNDFVAVRQMIIFQRKERRPDHIIFVNGLPLVILEYKDPTNTSTDIISAYDQLGDENYQKYIPKLFNYNAFLIISDRVFARYGTLTSSFERFSDWNDPDDPNKITSDRLDMMQKLMLNKETLLDIIQNYIEYEPDGKKIAQQHQYLGVKKAIKKTLDVYSHKNENRIGVIWHTTGSGKSLTMIFYTNIISQLRELENPTFVILTDRTDLDEQLNGFFEVAGFPYPKPKTAILEADSILDLREKLQTSAGKIIFTTIQKFQQTKKERKGMAKYPLISDRRNIIIIADEAHRSQYKKMAQNLQRALPNALKIGFTGTPIEKEDKSTTHVFGDIIASYKINDAVRDRSTVEITCQSRQVQLHLLNKMIGNDFEKITEHLDQDVVESLSKKGSQLKTILEDPDRLEVIAKDVVHHFIEKNKVLKGKAMLAATTKLAAARYANIISEIPGSPKCTCIISGTPEILEDSASKTKKSREKILLKHYKCKQEIEKTIKNFKDEKNDLKLLIVCDMYLTGFDAPVIHTMYVDKPMRDHNLIQAISRVNRIWKDKPEGMIIDYIGITDDLKNAFRAYNESDVERVMVPIEEMIKYMKKKHMKLISFFAKDIGSGKSFQERTQGSYLYDAINEILVDIKIRKEFIQNVTEMTKAYAVCTPDPACQKVEDDLKFFQTMRKLMANFIAGVTYIPSKEEDAIRDLVEEGITADGQIRFDDIRYDNEKIDLNREYIEKIKQFPQENLKVELAYKLLDDAIKSRLRSNISKIKSFQAKIEETLSNYHRKYESYDTIFPKFEKIAEDITKESQRQKELGLSDEEIAFYDIIRMGKEYVESDKIVKQIAIDVTEYVKRNTTIDWMNQDQVKAEIKTGIRKILLKSNFPTDKIEKIIPVIMQQTESNYGESEY